MLRYEFEEDKQATNLDQVHRSISTLESHVRKRVETEQTKNSILRKEVSCLREMRLEHSSKRQKCRSVHSMSEATTSLLSVKCSGNVKPVEQTTATPDISFRNQNNVLPDSKPCTTAFELSLLSQRPISIVERETEAGNRDQQTLLSMYGKSEEQATKGRQSQRPTKQTRVEKAQSPSRKCELLSKGIPTVHKKVRQEQKSNVIRVTSPPLPPSVVNSWQKNPKLPLRFRQL